MTKRIVSLADLQALRREPASKTKVLVGLGTCGKASGADETLAALKAELDKLAVNDVEIVQVGCAGFCYAEPTVEIHVPGKKPVLYGKVDTDAAKEIAAEHLQQGKVVERLVIKQDVSGQLRIAMRNCGNIDPEDIRAYIDAEGYNALGKILSGMTREQVISEVKASGLRGRGGGGFSTGMKWELAYKSPGPVKYVVCNADEGDPGAFMDRAVLEGDPHSVLEAMTIAGYAIGAQKGYIYIRAEYPLAIQRLQIAIGQARELGLLGDNIFDTDFSFDIELKYGAGAFVCGEETALIHSIEGSRGEPTVKPPYPCQSGLWEKPTSVNNVETFANIPAIFNKGAGWFAGIGTENSKGTKVFALAGKVKNVGLVEVPMGTSLRDIIFQIGGGIEDDKQFKAAQTGGPSGGCISPENLDIKVDYESLTSIGSMMGSGGLIVMDEDNCMVNIAQFYLGFTVDESCGRCTACRIGTKRLYEILNKIIAGQGTMEDLDRLEELGQVIKDTALCGLGQTAPNPVLSTMKYFRNEYLAHVQDKKCPAKQCSQLLTFTITDACKGCTLCVKNCPANCISGKVKEKHEIDQSRCLKCKACVENCKFDAIIYE